MKTRQELDDYLYPKNEELKRNEERTLVTTICDIEGDPLNCKFNYDDCVQIDTKEYSYITLSKSNLYKLIELIEESDEVYENQGV